MSENKSEVITPSSKLEINTQEHPATRLINSGKVSGHLISAHEKFDKEPTITPKQFASYKSSNIQKLPSEKKSSQ
jgi:hypothetical protein